MDRHAAGRLALLLVVGTVAAAGNRTHPATGLTFAEAMFVRLSGLCRAIADAAPAVEKSELVNSMKIVHIDRNSMKTFLINESFAGLTQPGLFDITKQTKVIIHGFRDFSQSAIPMKLAAAYNEKEMFNVLIVDAEKLLENSYIESVRNSRLIGKRLANLLANLENYGATAEDFHLLGISIGAHIAGWTGKYFQQFKSRRIGRITGLDPAGPCFSYAYSEQRLDKTDATYVDVLHTNRLMQGVIESLGHSDFYLNGGGPMQPGCIMPVCSHLRAAEAYAESITTPKSFVAVKCPSWNHFKQNACEQQFAVMGYGSPPNTRGVFYLRTSNSAPYGLGMEGSKPAGVNKMDNWLRTFNFAYLK